MMALSTFRLLVVITVLLFAASAQMPMGPPPLSEILIPNFGTAEPNEIVGAMFPDFLSTATTPVAIRIAYMYSIVTYNLMAACDATALSFFGVKDTIPASFCDLETISRINAHQYYRVVEKEFPQVASILAAFLVKNGLDPFDKSEDLSTPIGWANSKVERVVEYLSTDGWNSLGDATRKNYRQKFSNSIGYKPVNHADLDPQDLVSPLRWQPLIVSVDGRGTFTHQIHDMPHLGITGKPLVMTSREFKQRSVKGPYKSPNKRKRLGKADAKVVDGLIDEVFKTSRRLTVDKLLLAIWWNNKLVSTGGFASYYSRALGIYRLNLETAEIFLGDSMAQHDAMLVAWKEKVRHDLVRPTTLIRRLRAGKKVRAFISVDEGVRKVDAGEWEAAVPVQSHSEFPSASAVLCTASSEYLEAFVHDYLGNKTDIPYKRTLQFGDVQVKVNFKSKTESIRSCSQSRLDSGVHFSPAVAAGEELGTGIGVRAFRHLRDLVNGKVPDNCMRCGM